MRVTIGPLILCASGLLALGADQPGGPDLIREQITEQLDRAPAARTEEEAENILAEAERLLTSGRGHLNALSADFLSADLKRTRGRVRLIAWQRDAAKTGRRAEAKRLLSEAIEQYEQLKERAEEKASRIEKRLGRRDPEQDPAYRQARSYRSRANYEIAWAHYNLGLAAEGRDRGSHFAEAIDRFTSFTRAGYRNHPIVANCFLGQALCCFDLEQYSKVTRLLEPAEPKNTPEPIFKRMTYLRVKSYQKQARHRQLHEAADRYFAALPEDHKLDPVELGLAIEWAFSLGALARDPEANPYYRRYQNRLDAVAKMVYPYGDPWRSELARVVGETRGSSLFACLAASGEHFVAKRYQEALSESEKGLKAAGDRTEDAAEGPLADLRYMRAAAAWNLKRWARAHLAAFDFLRHHGKDSRTNEMCSRALQAGLKALEAQPQPGEPRLDAAGFGRFMTFAEDNFPANPEVGKADFYRGTVLLKAGQYREAEQTLQKVEPASPAYRRAQHGLALSAFKQAELLARAEEGDPAKQSELLRRSAAAVKRYVDAAAGGLPSEEHEVARAVTDVALAAGRHLLDLPTPDHAAALGLVDQIEKLVKALGSVDLAADERLALWIEAYVLAGQLEAATRRIDSMLQRKASSSHVARAFAKVADVLEKRHDRLVQAGKETQASKLGERLIRIYTFLLGYVSESKDAVIAGQEAAVRRRLARALQRRGNYQTAILHYRWLLERVPLEKSGDILQGLATAYEQTGQFDAAIEKWRMLAKGLEEKTDGWLEAHYHLIFCHGQAGRRDHARKLLARFRLQCPQVESELWRRRFEALGQELAGDES